MKTIKVPYVTLNFISTILARLQIEGKDASARRRFLRAAKPHLSDLEAEQTELMTKYCEKDAKGEAKVDNNNYVFTAKNRKEYNRKWEELNAQEVIFDVTDENERDIDTVKSVLLAEADRFENNDVKDGKFDAPKFEYVSSLREAAQTLMPTE